MSLTSYAALPLAAGYHTNMSEGGLIVLSIGAMLCLAALLIPVNLAAREPHRARPASMPPAAGPVQGSAQGVPGGVPAGEERGAAPHRGDEPAVQPGQGQAGQEQADQERA